MPMHKNPFWLGLLVVVFMTALVYTAVVSNRIYRHLQLSSFTEASAVGWSVKSEGEDSFVPEARYTFELNGKFYSGATLFYDDAVNNPWAAEEMLKPMAAKTHRVWYSPADPANSSMHKKFPLKESIYATVLWALSIYFFWLGVYVAKMQR